jgi:uncharacterized protein YegP (UPF0339 family)
MSVFELYRDSDAKFRFRMLDDGGAILAVSEPHEDKASALAAIEAARECAASSRIIDLCSLQFDDLPVKDGGHFLG